MKTQRVLGIDPGSVITGWGIVEAQANRLIHIANGGIFTKHKDFHLRLQEIYVGLCDVIANYQPQYASVEQVFVSHNAQSALKLGQARGVALLAAINSQLEISEYTPMQIKQAITGNGRADKSQVTFMVQTLLGLPEPTKTDAADALAAAICHLQQPSHPDLIAGYLPQNHKTRPKRSIYRKS